MMRNLNIPDHDGFEFDEILETPPADIESKMEAAWKMPAVSTPIRDLSLHLAV